MTLVSRQTSPPATPASRFPRWVVWHPDTLAWETHSVPWIEQIVAQAPAQDRERLTNCEQVRKDSMATEIIYLLCEHSLGIDI